MAVLRSLTTTLGLNSAQFRSELRRSQQSFSTFGNAIATGSKATAKAVGGIAAATAAMAAGAGAALYGLKQAYEGTDQIRRQAEMIGVSADQWSRYSHAARIAGTDTDALSDVFKDLNVKITDAAKVGLGSMVDFFAQINGDAREWSALSPDEQFRRFADELSRMSATDARFYLDEINDSATTLFETLRNGEFLRLADEAEQLGLSLTTGQFDLIAEARNELATLGSTGVSVWQQVLSAAAPVVSEISRGIRAWINDQAEAAGGFRQLGVVIAETVLTSIVRVAQVTEDVLNTTYAGAERVAQAMGKTLNPEKSALIEQLKVLQDEYRHLNLLINGTSPALKGQVVQPAQLERLSELSEKIQDVKTELSSNAPAFDFAAGLETRLSDVIAQVKAAQTEIASSGGAPVSLGAMVLDDGGDDGSDKEAKRIQTRLDALRDSYATEEELLSQKLSNEQDILRSALDAQLLTEDEYKSLKLESQTAYYEQLAVMEAEHAATQGSFLEQFQAQLKESALTFNDVWSGAFENFSSGVANSMAGAIVDGENFGDSMENVGKSMARAMIANLVEIGVQRMTLWALEQALGKAGGAALLTAVTGEAMVGVNMAMLNAFAATAAIPIVGPALAPAASAAAGAVAAPMAAAAISAAASTIAGARALGGEVLGGSTYLVGERGPELFQPGATGQITSNANLSSALRGNDGGGKPQAITLAPQIVVESGASQSGDEFLAENIAEQVFGMLMNDAHTGGAFSRALGVR